MRRLLPALLALLLLPSAPAREFTVVAYNVENLFDLDGQAGYEDYQASRYRPAHALTKLQTIARVLAQYEAGRGPDVVLLSELEVDRTPGATPPDYAALLAPFAGVSLTDLLGPRFTPAVADLPAEALLLHALKDAGLTGYQVVVADAVSSPGTTRPQEIRCAVLTRFPVRSSRSHPTVDARAILEVELEVDGARFRVFSNHWKSGASDPATEPTRIENARTLRGRLDELLAKDPQADLILGGDLNSQYNQRLRYPRMGRTGINDVLGSQGDELATRRPGPGLYNLWFEVPAARRGSDTYRGEWGTLMHLLISRGLYDRAGVQYIDNSFAIGIFEGLNADVKGLPLRWEFTRPAGRGASDHFPVSARFRTVPDGRPDQWLELRNPSDGRTTGTARRTINYATFDLPGLAVDVSRLAPDASIRTEQNKGKLFRVEGRVLPGERLMVEFRGEAYDVWSFDEDLRRRLRADHPAGATLRCYGELGLYRDRWQFVIQDPAWVK